MLISVIVTAYNLERCIEKCVDSLSNQTYKDIEIIVVEDCSTDKTKEKLLDLKKKHNFNLIENKENVGAGMSRRIGIEAATGEYVILIDGDDYVDNDYIEHLVNNAKETNSDIVSSGVSYEYGNGKWEKTSYGVRIDKGLDKMKNAFANKKIVFLNNKLVRRSLYDKVKYSSRRFIEDTQTIVPLIHFANQISYIENAGYHYVQRDTSLCHSHSSYGRVIHTALCVKDIVTFFYLNKIKDYEDMFNIKMFFNEFSKLKTIKYTHEDIEKYSKETEEALKFMMANI